MITYNPKDWLKLILQFHKSDTFRQLIPSMLGFGAFSALIVVLEIHYFQWSFKNSSIVHSILGFVLSMLLVFRTNTAYDRWWEGRKIWGDIVNNSRNLALKMNAFVGDVKLKKEFTHLIINYNYVLKDHLRSKDGTSKLYEMPLELSTKLGHAHHKPNLIAKEIFLRINALYTNKEISDTQFLILNDELKSFTNAAGACERIRNTPIPYSYNLFLKKIIFLYVASIPFMFASDFRYGTIVIAISMLYVFASIELIAEEIEDPFGEDDNDLPLDDICARIKSNLIEIVK
jgi:putative membrane protein